MQLDVFSYGESLLNVLEARRRADPSRPLLFIVHSLGGLILKDVSISVTPMLSSLLIGEGAVPCQNGQRGKISSRVRFREDYRLLWHSTSRWLM